MRDIPSALQAKLDSGVTPLARCWIVPRRDGAVSGFTDHDGDLVIDGVLVLREGASPTVVEERLSGYLRQGRQTPLAGAA